MLVFPVCHLTSVEQPGVSLAFTTSGGILKPGTSSVTFSGLDLGTSTANRKIVVCASQISASAQSGNISATVAGNACTHRVQAQSGSGVRSLAAILDYDLGAGVTSGDVVVTFSHSSPECSVGVYDLKGVSGAPTTYSGIVDPFAATVNVPTDGVVIACVAAHAGSGSTVAWTNVTEPEDYLNDDASNAHSSSALHIPAGDASRSITGDVSNTISGIHAGAAVTWGPGG